jgi:small subunit ribosomal protein S18
MPCVQGRKYVDHKNLKMLSKYVSSFARILPRRYTHTCIRHQKMISAAIKRARFLALLPYTTEHRQVMRPEKE